MLCDKGAFHISTSLKGHCVFLITKLILSVPKLNMVKGALKVVGKWAGTYMGIDIRVWSNTPLWRLVLLLLLLLLLKTFLYHALSLKVQGPLGWDLVHRYPMVFRSALRSLDPRGQMSWAPEGKMSKPGSGSISGTTAPTGLYFLMVIEPYHTHILNYTRARWSKNVGPGAADANMRGRIF